jgi:endonuclease/exonuclease/phosphatase family metal-dependent hydrolase
MTAIRTAFWNLQNLFDTTASPIAADLEFTPDTGWTAEVQQAKVRNLGRVINGMFDGQGPDLLGICEIENVEVSLQLLAELDRDDLVIAHVDSPDIRGIDCSLIFSEDRFELAGEPVGHLVHLRYPTRDIFQVPLTVKENGADLMVLVNHWPSRRMGAERTEPFRITVASHCGQLADTALKLPRADYLNAPDTPETMAVLQALWNGNVLIMGDLNDEPYNRSVMDELRASKGLDRLEESLKAGAGRRIPSVDKYLGLQAPLFNCMWPLASYPDQGTHYFSGSINTMNMLDQFIVSRGLYYGLSGLRMGREFEIEFSEGEEEGHVVETARVAADIFRPAYAATARKGRPKAFEFWRDKTTGEAGHNNGFSDHFPIVTEIDVL